MLGDGEGMDVGQALYRDLSENVPRSGCVYAEHDDVVVQAIGQHVKRVNAHHEAHLIRVWVRVRFRVRVRLMVIFTVTFKYFCRKRWG